MASRGPFGFRAKSTETEKRDTKQSAGLSRKGSITSNNSNNSRLPRHATSLFSRHKSPKPQVEPSSQLAQPTTSLPIGRGQTTANVTSATGLPTLQSKGERGGLGISVENKTAQVSKSGKTRNVLRRKTQTVDSRFGYARTESSASSYDPPPSRQAMDTKSSPEVHSDPFPNQVLGITTPSISSTPAASRPHGLGPSFEFDTSSSRMARYNSRKTPSPAPPSNNAPPTPSHAHDSGSSARFSDSPSSFSHSSTPTSMTSQSPGISTPVSVPSTRGSQKPTSQSRPPVAMANKWRQGFESSSQAMSGLSAVRESGTSSSSSSTVKASGSRDESSKISTKTGRSSPLVPTFPASVAAGKTSSGSYQSSGRGDAPRPTFGLSESRAGKQPLAMGSGARSNVAFASSSTVPIRPSREGVPSLDMQKLNLNFAAPRTGPSSLTRSPSTASSAAGQQNRLAASPNLVSERSIRPSEGLRNVDAPSLDTKVSSAKMLRDPSPQSVTSTKSTSRFALFSRRTRSPLEPSASDLNERNSRKGPAAGTGHEGYGKYARRGRSGSMSTSASRGRSTSSNSIGRTPSSRKSSLTSRDEEQMDDFYRSRLEPKKILGGGQSVTSSTHGSEVYLDDSAGGPSSASAKNDALMQVNVSSFSERQMRSQINATEDKQTHALRHVDRRLPDRDAPFQRVGQTDRPMEVSSSIDSGLPTLATRRSIHRSQLQTGADPVKIPAPIDTRAVAPSPALDSQNTYQSSIPQSDSTVPLSDDISEGHEGNWLKPTRREKSAKSPKKWSFFHRGPGSPKKAAQSTPSTVELERPPGGLRAQVARIQEPRNVAFYELINSSEQGDIYDNPSDPAVGTSQLPLSSSTENPDMTSSPTAQQERQAKLSMLLPSPPRLATEFPDMSKQPKTTSKTLQPPFVPRSDEPKPTVTPTEPRKPRLQQIGRIPRVVSKRDRQHVPAPQSFSRPRPFAPRQEPSSAPPVPGPSFPSNDRFNSSARPLLGLQTTEVEGLPDQLSAKPASAPVGSVESSGRARPNDEFLVFPPRIGSEVSGSSSSGNLSIADITAVVPKPGSALTEEEEWNEYNDFLDIMESPAPLANQKSNPYEKSVKDLDWAPAPLEIRKEGGSLTSATSSIQNAPIYPPALPPTRKLPSPPKKPRRSTPSPVKEVTQIPARGRPSDNQQRLLEPQRRSLVASSRYSTSSIESEADSLAGLENLAPSRVDVPAHLRLELLTTSKLLSFDRVLFSPAHAEVSSNRKNRVLVLDGLGVDDWAFFCAQEYPHAQISNLSATPRTAVMAKNYEHHHYPSLDGPFPFPQNFFTAAVLRFPAVNTEDAFSNVIKEFRRVLCPGGYLEISVMDIDMVKMGSETRRALRGLKERKQSANPRVSLKPLSDNIQKMLGGKAFENLKQCMLEIPVASHGSSRVRSFNEKMELLDEMPRDEDQTRHLPEIGRWWFSRCYETGQRLSTQPARSIWENQSMLEECKAMETGFKMLLCYAQKPGKRRTLSL